MKALVDGDILLHELGWSGEFTDKESGKYTLLDFDHVKHLVDEKINLINYEVRANEPPTIFISNSQQLTDQINRERRLFDEEPLVFVPNFRYEVAKTKPYKGNRKNPKPFHFNNILTHLRTTYDTVISQDGLEADDELAIYQVDASRRGRDTTICSRDKDLRIVPGHHYSWECGKQRAIGPTTTDRLGRLEKREDGQVLGYGLLFYFYQLLAGDAADNIPGLHGCGTVAAYNALEGTTTEEDAYQTVKRMYIEKLGDQAKERFLEQAKLLWIVQERGKGYVRPGS